MESLPPYLRQFEAAEALGCDRKVLQRAEAQGHLCPIRYGHETFYSREQLLSLHELRSQKQ